MYRVWAERRDMERISVARAPGLPTTEETALPMLIAVRLRIDLIRGPLSLRALRLYTSNMMSGPNWTLFGTGRPAASLAAPIELPPPPHPRYNHAHERTVALFGIRWDGGRGGV